MKNDRAAMELALDQDVKAVLGFMQSNIAVSKLVGVADGIAKVARLLWAKYPQEPCEALTLVTKLPVPNTPCATQQAATE